MASVFDVAIDVLEHSRSRSIESLKLQKLTFYAFGWYAHLTGKALFDEQFYAMEYGPVVGELLSAHAGHRKVKRSMLETQIEVRDSKPRPLDPYEGAVLDAIWSAYGAESAWSLVERTHKEGAWKDAWETRPSSSKRGTITHSDLIAYFLDREPRSGEHLDLPPSLVSRVSMSDFLLIDAATGPHLPFVHSVQSLLVI